MSSEEEGEPMDALERAERGLGALSDEEEPTRRRRGNRDKDARKEKLKLFKAGNRDALLQAQEDDLLYDEVDENEYRERVRQRREDDFIVDDGTGEYNEYADHGGELWDEEDFVGDSEAAQRAKRRKSAFGDRKVQKKPKVRVANIFTAGNKTHKQAKPEDPADDSFVNSLLAEEGYLEDEPIAKPKKAPQKWGLQQLVLRGEMDAAPVRERARPAARANPFAAPGTAHSAGRTARDQDDFPAHMEDEEYRDAPGLERDRDDSPPPRPAAAAASAATEKPKAASSSSAASRPTAAAAASATNGAATVTSSAGAARTAAAASKPVVRVLAKDDDDDEPAASGKVDYLTVSKATVESAEDWTRVRDQNQNTEVADVQVDSSRLPLVTLEDGTQVLRMYWLDAYEGEHGLVYLFGKVWMPDVKAFLSCCVTVRNVERNLFVLPRDVKLSVHNEPTSDKVEMSDVYEEVGELLTSSGVQKFLCKPVTRKYAFELPDVPAEATFLKIKYSAEYPRLSGDTSGRTFSHILGTTVGPLERFLMKRDLMGPCWLDIRGVKATKQSISWCKLEAEIDNPKNVTKTIEPPPSPPVVVLSICMQTIQNRKTHENEILMLCGVVHSNVQLDGPTESPKSVSHFTAIRKLGDNPLPPDLKARLLQSKNKTAEVHPNERALLGQFMARLARVDPDIIVGHNLLGFDLDVLLRRIKMNNIPHWSRVGRLRRSVFPKLQAHGGRASYAERTIACGRLLCDVKVSAREFIRIVNYEMTELARTQLGTDRSDIDPETIPALYSQSDTLLHLTEHVERDAFLILMLMFKLDVLPLSKQITSVTGGLLARTFAGGRAERNEFLLCHEFHRNRFIVPDKQYGKQPVPIAEPDSDDDAPAPAGSKSRAARRKPQYSGGLVLEPKKGFYDTFILLLDFNSLYPSIIQEYNICFTTIKRKGLAEGALAELPDPTLDKGILPRVLKTLIAKRRAVKELIKGEKNPDKLAEYDIRQKALKLTANSMYGCLGFGGSRFYARPLAELITAKGREILQKTVDLTQTKLGLEVIYGDTDSIMINTKCTNLTEVKGMGGQVRKEVNALYKELEIDIDGVFKTMLLLKKKKYAALAIKEKNGEITTTQETKGLDIVRRDWCGLSHEVGNYVLRQILSRETREDLVETCHEFLRQVAADVATPGKIALEKFIIHKGLTKNPEEYADKQNQPHVQVALRMKAAGKAVRALDTIPYIVADDGTPSPATQRAYHPDDFRKNTQLKVDTKYYLANQIHPVVSRLIEPIEGTDNAQIAECLGLDMTAYRADYRGDVMEGEVFVTEQTDEDRYRDTEPLTVRCLQCGESALFPGPLRTVSGTRRCSLLCPNPSCTGQHDASALCNTLTLRMRHFIDKFYVMAVKCDEGSCPNAGREHRAISVRGRHCPADGCRGLLVPLYSSKQLHNQLSFFLNLFNAPKALQALPQDDRREGESLLAGHMATFESVYKHINATFKLNGWNTVSLASLFGRVEERRRPVPMLED
eukprot:m.135750 g.135750  ORF g.135750 m.135750 type:complete len:1505 (+) comp14876_c1_seq4:44-4558(+)